MQRELSLRFEEIESNKAEELTSVKSRWISTTICFYGRLRDWNSFSGTFSCSTKRWKNLERRGRCLAAARKILQRQEGKYWICSTERKNYRWIDFKLDSESTNLCLYFIMHFLKGPPKQDPVWPGAEVRVCDAGIASRGIWRETAYGGGGGGTGRRHCRVWGAKGNVLYLTFFLEK